MRSYLYVWSLLIWCGVLAWSGTASAQGTASCVKPNVLIILNKSNNMNTTKWNQARIALGQLVQARDQNTRFGLMLFDASTRIAVTIRDNALQQMAIVVVQTQPGGNAANHKAAIAAARTYLTAEITRDTEAGRSYSVLLVTDGNTSDGDIAADLAALQTLSVNGRTKVVQTYIMGVSPGTNGTALNQWATAGGTGRYYSTTQVTQLSTVLQQNEPNPQPEQCNGRDDDCDGQTDENLQRPCLGQCPGGTTAAGTQICQNGAWGTCQVQRRPETCNGRDDDCNGVIDDQIQPLACQTACGTGTLSCVAGRWVNCTAPQPSPEICDGKDNNCDGQIDEGCPCRPGQTRPCGSDTGECTKGSQACVNGQWSATCIGEGAPTPEICDNKDNDCDGLIDENLRQVCNNGCGNGVETCSAGKWGGCTAPQPVPETCNGRDDNCDGVIDEGCPCQIGQTRPCGSNVGTCRQGINICITGQWSTNCINSQGPTPEVCDGQDNNCNGTTDENLTRPCKNACGVGNERCAFGRWIGCDAPTPQPEVCDGIDNNCDGQIDENIARACYTGPPGTQGVGVCTPGKEICTAGKWSMCTGEVLPVKGICDGKDNDCDGKIDTGCPCKAGDTQACGIDIGACQKGKQACVNSQWGPCTGGVLPSPELCDGIDNNCDGQVDESLSRNCTNACGQGQETCLAGRWVNCTAPQPRPEICGNNQDDNCDGQIDENCPCRPGQTRPCGSTIGECQAGVQECTNGTWSDVCKGGVTSTPEVCDKKDNDCDGQIDNGITCACQDGARQPCYSGPPNTAGVGLCKAGIQVCTNSQWSPCVGEVLPAPELCDNLDNNCDGNRDEKITQACKTPCGVGLQLCSAGQFGPCSAPPPRPEICGNGIDDDCNGLTDENCPCRTGQTRPCGALDIGECKKGIETCVANQWSGVCIGEIKPTPEVCDGKDNDCNGKIDDAAACACKDGEKRPCYTGPPNTVNVGNCRSGGQICQGGVWGPCQGESTPTEEVCDGKDNNCDGSIDERLARRCSSPCGEGRQECNNGTFGPCSSPPPTPEVCDGRDNDCNGTIDDGAPCPPNSACIRGQCIPTVPDAGPDQGISDVGKPECRFDHECTSGFVCREFKCVPEVRPDTNPDIAPDATPDTTPDTTPLPTTCTVNTDCGAGNVCRWGRCHKGCSANADCPGGQSGTCLLGLCVPQCVADKHCVSGMVCRAGWCRDACRTELDCKDGKSCIGFACALGCSGDTDCAASGSHCLDGKHCAPRCNLAADCPPGFACNNGKCTQACSSFDQARSCSQTLVCSAGRCESGCSGDTKCPSVGSFECKDNLCVQKCASDAECKSTEACLSGQCIPRCSIQDDCRGGSRCHDGLCFPTCKTAQDCPSGRACLEGRCVDACQASSPAPPGPTPIDGGPTPSPDSGTPAPPPIPIPVDAGDPPDANPPAPDTSTPDAGQALCPGNAQVCAGDSCHVTCTNAATCKTGYVCSTSCDGCTDLVCLPTCRVDVDCPSQFFCQRGICRLGCQNDAQCESGEQCINRQCTRPCNVDNDCPMPQICENKKCVDPDPQKEDRGNIGKGNIPTLKLAGGCGCQSTQIPPSSWMFFLLLALLTIPAIRRKQRS